MRASKQRVSVRPAWEPEREWWVSLADAEAMVESGAGFWEWPKRKMVLVREQTSLRGPSCTVSGKARHPGAMSYLEQLATENGQELREIGLVQVEALAGVMA